MAETATLARSVLHVRSKKTGRLALEQNTTSGFNRRSFLRNAGVGSGVLALGPLAASLASSTAASAAAAGGANNFDVTANRIGTDSVKWDSAIRTEHMDHIVAGMGIADMDFKTAPAITAGLRKQIAKENWGYIDMGSPGPKAWMKGIVDWNRSRYGITAINEGNMAISTGVHAGILATMAAYAPPGSKVLLATPIYNGFYGDIKATKTVANESLMKMVNGRYEIDWVDFEAKASMPDTKVTILCNPQNPVGRAWSKEELTRYGEICLKHNVLVLSDEIHCDFIMNGQKYVPFATLDNKDVVNNSITYKSVSKSFSLAGMKVAWFFSTNPEVFKATVAHNRADLSTMGMVAAQSAYAGAGNWLTECVTYIDGNQKFANDYIKANIPMIKVGNKPEGTYLQWIDISAIADKIGAKKMADEANQQAKEAAGKMGTDYSGRQEMAAAKVVTPEEMVQHWFGKNAFVQLNAGTSYGLGGANHMRMNIATSRKTLKAALDSMAAATKKISA
jgi:cystathionine beta-lyase